VYITNPLISQELIRKYFVTP